MSTIKVDKITGKTGSAGASSPLQFNGDTLTLSNGVLSSGVTGGSGLTHLASNPTVTLGSNATFPVGHIVDVKTAIYTGESGYGGNVDGEAISALSVTMNPADGNDILITCNIACSASSGVRGAFWVSKSGTSFMDGNVGATNGNRHRASSSFAGFGDNRLQQCSFQNLDVDPYTGSSITYTVIADGEGTYAINVNKSSTNSDSASVYVASSSITAMEIQR